MPSYCPYDDITAASKATFHTGNAARAAARDARSQLLAMAAARVGVPVESLCMKGGRIFTEDGKVSIKMSEAFGVAAEIVGRGSFSRTTSNR